MARPLDSAAIDDTDDGVVEAASSRLDRAAARAFAAAVSALIISTLVVSQSSAAIDPDGTVAGNAVAAGTVELSDDDGGRSLVDLQALAPRRPVEECITISYTGSILPVELTLEAQTVGNLDPYLDVMIERGDGGGFDDCEGFVPENTLVFDGTLEQLEGRDAMMLGRFYNTGDSVTFRFRFELRDDAEAAGRESSIDFVWEAAP